LVRRRRTHIADQVQHPGAVDALLEAAYEWVRDTGWPTYASDQAIAGDVYEKWIRATDAEYAATQSRDFDLLGDLLRGALAPTHDEAGLDALHVLLMLDLTLRGRQEGKLKRKRIH
jgi:hypothetical protein